MRIVIDPRQPHILVVQPRNRAFLGATAMAIFGCFALVGGLHNLIAQPATYRMYGIILICLAVPSLLFGCLSLFRRVQYSFDRAAGTAHIEHKGLFRTHRTTRSTDSLEAVVLVRYWFFNRIARAESDFRYRLQLHAPSDQIELESSLSEAEASEAANSLASFLQLPVQQHEDRAEGVVAGR